MNYDNALFDTMRFEYLRHLQLGGARTEVIPGEFRPRVEGDLRPRSSTLGLCPKAAANEILGVEPAHPELLPVNQPDLLHLFESGHSCARSWQETVQWCCDKQGWKLEVEVPCDDELTTGTMDMLIIFPDGAELIIEVKRTDKVAIRNRAGELHSPQHFLQTCDYLRKRRKLQGNRVKAVLLRDYRSHFQTFWIKQEPQTGRDIWYSITLNGTVLEEVLTGKELRETIQRHQIYIDKETTGLPYETPVEHWQCATVRKGTGTARCPFFARCWPVSNPFEIVDGKIWTNEGEYYEVEK